MRGITFALLILLAAAALGYTAWETRNLRASFDRMDVGNETSVTELMISLARTEGQLARIRQSVESLGGSAGTAQVSDVTALEGRMTAALTAGHREVVRQELARWTRRLEDQRKADLASLRKGLEQRLGRSAARAEEGDRRWTELKGLVEANQKTVAAQLKALGDGLSAAPAGDNEPGAALTNLEERLAAVLQAAENNRNALTQRNQRDDKRWKDIFLALEENKQALQQRYAELAARLDQRADAERQPAQPPPARPQEPAPGAGQQAQSERERLLAFCAELPDSPLCQDL